MKSDLLSRIALAALLCFGLVLTGCYDDSALRSQLNDYGEQLDDHELRLRELERLCSQFNTNISALQTAMSALEKNVYVTSVNPVKNGSDVIGYVIVFSNSETATIYHGSDGKDGADGHTPVVGVKMDTDSVYYWTLDGKWLLDDLDAKLPVTGPEGSDGKDGQAGAPGTDGVTPKLKIEDGYWYVSYDGGNTWEEESLGKAVGENGDDGVDGDSFFRNVVVTDDDVTFIFKDGTEVSMPISQKDSLDITFNCDPVLPLLSDDNLDDDVYVYTNIEYEVTGGSGGYIVRVLWSNPELGVSNRGPHYIPNDDGIGYLGICRLGRGAATSLNSALLVSVTDSEGAQAFKLLNIVGGGRLESVQDVYEIDASGGLLEIRISTNMRRDFYSIDTDGIEWIKSVIPTKSSFTVREDVLEFNVEENEGWTRMCQIKVKDAAGYVVSTIPIVQYAPKDIDVADMFLEGDYAFLEWLMDNRAYGDATPTLEDLEAGNLDGFTGINFGQDAAGKWFVKEIFFYANGENPSSNLFNSFPPTVNLQHCESIFINCTADGTDPSTMTDWMKCPLAGSELPTTWNCPKLWRLHLECVGMQGVISPSLAALPALEQLFIRCCDVYGALPHEWKSDVLNWLVIGFGGQEADCPNMGYIVPATFDVILNSERGEDPRLRDKTGINIAGAAGNWLGYENGWGQKRYERFDPEAKEGNLTVWSDFRGLTQYTSTDVTEQEAEIAPSGLRNPKATDNTWCIDSWAWFYYRVSEVPTEMHEWNQAEADAFTAEMAARPRIFTRE